MTTLNDLITEWNKEFYAKHKTYISNYDKGQSMHDYWSAQYPFKEPGKRACKVAYRLVSIQAKACNDNNEFVEIE